MRETENGVSWVHRLAALVAVAAFCTIVLGALVAANAAALPRSPGGIERFTWSLLSGGVKYEPAYRIMAAACGLLSSALAILLLGGGAARYIKVLGLITAVAGAIQLYLSSIPASPDSPPGAAIAIAGAAEIFFTLALSMALFTRTDWRWNEAKTADVASPSLRNLFIFINAATIAASILGTQTHPSVFPHLLGGCIVTLASLWAVEIALNKFSEIAGLKIPAILLAELASLQLFLGIVAHSMELNARATALPMPGLIVIKSTHAAVGALVLIASFFATFQAFKYLAPRVAEPVAPIAGKSKMEGFGPE
jgi:hypothetical protein